MRELDSAVGKILASLKSLKIDNNTLVFFSSDNGGATYAKQNGTFPIFLFILKTISQQKLTQLALIVEKKNN